MIEKVDGKPIVEVTIRRDTQYRCLDDNEVEFNTSRNGNTLAAQMVLSNYGFGWHFSRKCEQKCNRQNAILVVEYMIKRINSPWYTLGNVTYLYKNCDKLYWTNWIEITNCSLSRHRNYVRNCEDCDGDEVDKKHCDGNSTMQEDCQPIWGEWTEERSCVVSGCNPTTGERVKRRECLYGDGSDTMNYELCSNTSAIVTEQCTNNTLPIECSANTASLYIGIGVALVLIVILFIFLEVTLYYRRKGQTNSTPNQNPNTHELPITRSIATVPNGFGCEQSVVLRRYDCEQMASSQEYTIKQPVKRPVFENFQSRFSGANECGQQSASHAFELEQSVEPSAYKFKQREKLNEYESNMPHGANPPTVSQSAYSTVQKHGKSTEGSNEYSSLAKTIPVTESEYSRLSPR